MRVVITGGTGFIGRYVVNHFLADAQNEVIVLTRNERKARKILPENVQNIAWDGKTVGQWVTVLEGADLVVHLAGHSVAGVWTVGRKQKIYRSRMDSTRALVKAFQQINAKPATLVQMSATGFYGSRGDELLTEDSEQGKGFLAAVVENWEAASREMETLGIRRILLRTGVVLGKDGGVLPLMARSFQWFLGAMPGDGMDWFPWIHVKEIPLIIQWLYHKKTLKGVFNCVAPEPVRMETFCQTLGKVLNRPCWLSIPEWFLHLLPGHQAEEMILVSQRVIPQRLVQAGYTFKFPTLYVALSEIFDRQDVPLAPPENME